MNTPDEKMLNREDASIVDLLNLEDIPRTADIISIAVQRASRLLRADLNRILVANGGLSLVEFRLLRLLNNSDVLSQKELTKEAYMEQGQVSRALASLEKKDYVSSCPYPLDRRVRLFSMRAKGNAAFQEARPKVQEHNAYITAFLEADDKALVVRSLQEIVRRSADSAAEVEGRAAAERGT